MLAQDIKHAIRALLRKPGFTAVIVLTLAIGIGANAAIFGAVNAVLLRPLPFPEPDRLVHVFTPSIQRPDRLSGATSPPDFTDWRSTNTAFAEMAAFNRSSFALTGNGSPEQMRGAFVTGTFFDVLGTRPLHGRTIAQADAAIALPTEAQAFRFWLKLRSVGPMWWCSVMPCGAGATGRTRRSSADAS